jgi:hypothetical protein
MSEADLKALERDVERARAKFAGDLARLRSPDNFARFKEDLWTEVRETKDEVLDQVKENAQDGAQRLLAELKARVAANPLATIAIGAGLAWRLVHRPPIASALVGLGLLGLARTTPPRRNSQPYMGLTDEDPRPLERSRASGERESPAEALADVANEWKAQAADAVRETTNQIADKAASVRESASDVLQDATEMARGTAARASEMARETAARAADKARAAAARATETLRGAVPDRDERDAVLLGAAALAVAAAVGIAYQRRGRPDA